MFQVVEILQRRGNSIVATIRRPFLHKLKWTVGTHVTLHLDETRRVIEIRALEDHIEERVQQRLIAAAETTAAKP